MRKVIRWELRKSQKLYYINKCCPYKQEYVLAKKM